MSGGRGVGEVLNQGGQLIKGILHSKITARRT